MPPKSKKEKKNRKSTIPLNEIDTTNLTREKLEEFCLNVAEDIKKTHESSEWLRLDRDKLAAMVAISREQLTHVKGTLVFKEHDAQDAEDSHRLAMRENRQKLTHIVSEKNTATINSKLESLQLINREELNHKQSMVQIETDMQELKNQMKAYENSFSEEKSKQEIVHAEDRSKIRAEDKEDHILKENSRDKMYTSKVKELEMGFHQEYTDFEKCKNKEICLLLKNNWSFVSNLKHYYNQVVQHNMSVINVTRQDYEQLKKKAAAIDKQFRQLREENNHLTMATRSAQAEEAWLREKLASSQKDQDKLKHLKMDLKKTKYKLEHDNIRLEVLNMRVDKQQKLADEDTHDNDLLMFNDITRAEEVVLVLEFILTNLCHRDKEADSALNQIKRICLKKGKKCKRLKTANNSLLDEMYYQIATVAHERERILSAYQAVLAKYKVPVDNTGLTPFSADDLFKSAASLAALIHN